MAFVYQNHDLVWQTSQHAPRKIAEWLESVSRPLYLYDLNDIDERVDRFQQAFSNQAEIHYALKANNHPEILKLFLSKGAGIDVVSGGELQWALSLGFKAQDVVFSGVAKTEDELDLAISQQVGQINIESPQELQRVAERAKALKKKARVAFRMNPDVDPVTHPYIKTGFRENKFGLAPESIPELLEIIDRQKQTVVLCGLSIHIGSQLRDLGATLDAVRKLKSLCLQLLSQGYQLETMDVGGGLGIDYHAFPSIEEWNLMASYGQQVYELVQDVPLRLLTEPGRILVARSGLLLTQVQYVKKTAYKNFAIVNTGMHHLLRPALYQAYHRILPLQETAGDTLYDVVGPICESSDVLGFDRHLPSLNPGDWLAIADAGAYGRTMWSDYNMHPRPHEWCIRDGELIKDATHM